MKIVYVKTMLDKIQEAKIEAAKQNRKIDYIEVTAHEFRQLLSETSDVMSPVSRPQLRTLGFDAELFGIKIMVVGRPARDIQPKPFQGYGLKGDY